MRKPPALKPGDKIGIIVPSSPVKEPFRSDGLNCIRELGYIPVEVENILSKARSDFLAREPEQSLEDIRGFFNDPEIKAIWAARGGYGSNLLLPLLNRLEIPNPKIIIGSSDLSYLLWYLNSHFDMAVFYGPMAYSSLPENRYNRDQLQKILTGDNTGIKIEGKVLVPGKIKTAVTGGCLTNFVSLLGTPYFPEVKDRILLLEDTSERPYRLDRMFWQARQAGIFSKIKGLLLGQFPGCFSNEAEKVNFLDRVQFYLNETNIPIIYDLPLGHGYNIHTLPLGIDIEIDTNVYPDIILSEKGVNTDL